MDSGSSDKYLHKKFKKQLNVADPPKPSHHDNNDKETKATLSSSIQEKSTPQVPSPEDNKDSVPNQSTKNRTTSSPPSSVYYDNRSSISKVDDDVDAEARNSTTITTCISYATDRTDHTDRPYSVSEPIVDDTRTDQSSILDYPSYAIPSKYNQEDNHYEKDHYQEDHPSSFLEKPKKPGEPQENNSLVDKTTGGKHVCPYCSLACSKPSVLQKHIRAHTNERPYPCDQCGFSFKTRSNLYKHCRSRTHANRVMGNKLQEIVTEMEVDPKSPEEKMEVVMETEKSSQEQKSKPYKPRFHTAKAFFDSVSKENVSDNEKSTTTTETPKRPNSDLLSIRINEVISKNNSIVNSTDPYLLKRRSIDNTAYQDNNGELSRYYNAEQKNSEEPLNLTNKNRKRCLSEVAEPAQKSLIKELLLKNLYADTNMQCPYCKMIFQTVTELELHKLRSCKGYTKSSARYNRSSSVNVASILTQNKNAFDSLAYPLKSPGPFLGKTRLVESDKNKSFSFDDNLAQTSLHSLPSTSDLLRTSQRYALSPLTIQTDKEKKQPVKLFGGEVKIAHSSGETRSFKIDGKDDGNFLDFGGKLSENRLVKSTLQSGGTVLTNKPAYTQQDSVRNSPDVLRVYENNSCATPKAETKFTFDNHAEQNKSFSSPVLLRPVVPETSVNSSGVYKYTNIVDFSQKAAKMLTPNLKQFNLTMPGITMPNKFASEGKQTRMEVDQQEVVQNYSQKEGDVDRRNLEFAERQITLQQKMPVDPPQLPLYNPVNLLVNGKVVRYVPGIPGPVVDAPLDMAYSSNIISTNRAIPPAAAMRLQKPSLVLSPLEPIAIAKKLPVIIENHTSDTLNNNNTPLKLSPKADVQKSPPPPPPPKTETSSPKSTDSLAPEMGPPATETRKFSRPNSLALKPTLASMKTHHGLTPTVFNQILISPDTPRVAKKYNQHMIHGNYFTYLGLKSSTKSVYCTLNKTQPVYVPHFKKLSMYSEWRQQENKSEKLYVSGYDSRQRLRRYTVAGKASLELTVVHSSYKYVGPESTAAGNGKSDEQKSGTSVGSYESNEDYAYARRRDDSTRQQEHEAAYGLLSLSQKTSPGGAGLTAFTPSDFGGATSPCQRNNSPTTPLSESTTSFIDNEELVHVSKKTFAKNKILDLDFSAKRLSELPTVSRCDGEDLAVVGKVFGKTVGVSRPLSYPYTSPLSENRVVKEKGELKSIRHFQVIQNYNQEVQSPPKKSSPNYVETVQVPIVKVNDKMVMNSSDSDNSAPADLRKRKVSSMVVENVPKQKIQRSDGEVMDLSVPERRRSPENLKFNGSNNEQSLIFTRNHHVTPEPHMKQIVNNDIYTKLKKNFEQLSIPNQQTRFNENYHHHHHQKFPPQNDENSLNISYVIEDRLAPAEYDNSAMETLADIATKQVKLEKNSVAKNVATEFLKLATKSEFAAAGAGVGGGGEGMPEGGAFVAVAAAAAAAAKKVNELIVKPEENKSCTICSKSFSKPSQLRLHMNIHYLERPFRCDSCSVGFRTKGQLQKHERSAGHHNKLSSSPALSSSEPRPFKCSDCNIAFRIHGHLAKHLRSKMHIMKLECLAKIPFGLYAELERSNSLLTEINTADGDQCLDSLKTLAKKVFMNDPNKLTQLEVTTSEQDDIDS